MLQAISDRTKGWLGGAVIALITLPFALWGISSYFSGGKIQDAATVDGNKIPVQQLENSVAREKQQLRQRFGNKLPFSDMMIKKEVLDQLINQKVLEIYTQKNGYRVSDFQLFANIKSIFSQDGKFDRAVFENAVRSQGQTIPQFENELRNQIRVSQFNNGIRSTVIVTDAEAERLAKLEAQQREISLLRFNVANQLPDVKITDADVQKVYDSQPQRFMTQEQVSVDYIELTDANFEKDVKVDEQKVQQAYKTYVAQVEQKEERKASHILIKPEPNRAAAMKKIEKIKKLLAEGKSFASLAKEYSDDKGSAAHGGSLDWVDRGQMVKPFEDALFKLKKPGDVSGVVETQFGLHLIKLDDIRKQKPLSLAAKRKSIVEGLKHDAIGGLFYDASEKMANTSYENPDSLDATAKALGVPVKTSGLMTRTSGTGIGANPKVREAAFSGQVLNDNLNSDVIDLGSDHVVVLRVHEHVPARKLPLEKVRASLTKQLQHEKAEALTVARARDAKDQIMAGKPASSFVTKGIKLDKPLMLKRTDTGKLNPAALQLTFEMTKPQANKVTAAETVLDGADVAVIILHKVVTPKKVAKIQLDEIKRRRQSDFATSEYKAALSEISAGFKIEKNSNVLKQ
jgi:peptidyl-prolyl cis-trans isomerase D